MLNLDFELVTLVSDFSFINFYSIRYHLFSISLLIFDSIDKNYSIKLSKSIITFVYLVLASFFCYKSLSKPDNWLIFLNLAVFKFYIGEKLDKEDFGLNDFLSSYPFSGDFYNYLFLEFNYELSWNKF